MAILVTSFAQVLNVKYPCSPSSYPENIGQNICMVSVYKESTKLNRGKRQKSVAMATAVCKCCLKAYHKFLFARKHILKLWNPCSPSSYPENIG